MPATYEPIATTTLSTASASVTFSSISGSYTNLVVVINTKVTSGTAACRMRFNSDTGTNYSFTTLSGNGSSAYSFGYTNQTSARLDEFGYLSTEWSVNTAHLMNYANTTTNKTMISRCSNAGNGADAVINLYRSTSAITSIEIYPGTSTFVAGSTFTLYGIKAA